MKKQKIPILVLITCVFAAFVFGFFAGRNLNRTPVQIRAISPAPEATASATEEALSETTDPEAEAASSQEASFDNSDADSVSFPLNINTATTAQLENLPGIGPVIAQRIVDYRDANGPYSAPSQLLNVSGIGQKRLDAIWDYITIGE